MTKKDYEQLVRILRKSRCKTYGDYPDFLAHYYTLVRETILWLKHDNPLFNEGKFEKAVFK